MNKVVATFEYKDIEGKTLYIKERIEPGRSGRGKEFFFKHSEGNKWIAGRGCEPVPYNLPALSKSKNPFVVEGEGKADLLDSWDLTATCLDSGANSPFREDYLRHFEGKEKVVILPDNDNPGKVSANKIASALHGKVEKIKVVELPDLKEAEDIINWAKKGNNKAKLLEIVKASPEWTPKQDKEYAGIIPLHTITPVVVKWFWKDRIPLGKLTLFDGDPGLGKSHVSLDFIARVSNNLPMPDGTPSPQGGAVLLTLEDGLADTIVPRLKAAGADLSKIVALQSVHGEDGKSRFPTVSDIEAIERACGMIQAKIVVIDPLMAHLGGAVNSWRDQDVRCALTPLTEMAENLDVAVVVIRHLNKSGGSQSIYRGGGSIGIIGAARCAYLIAKDPEDGNKRVFAGIKNNLAPLPPSLIFTIEGIENSSRVIWGGVSAHSADALLAIPSSPEERSALDEAVEFLRDMLGSGGVNSKEVQRQARQAGIAEKTLQRAKKRLGVVSKKSQFEGGWVWTLAEDGQNMPKMVNKNDDHLGGNLTTFAKDDGEINLREGEL